MCFTVMVASCLQMWHHKLGIMTTWLMWEVLLWQMTVVLGLILVQLHATFKPGSHSYQSRLHGQLDACSKFILSWIRVIGMSSVLIPNPWSNRCRSVSEICTVIHYNDYHEHTWTHKLACTHKHTHDITVLPRLLLQGAAPCPLFVTPCPFEKAEMTPCPFD